MKTQNYLVLIAFAFAAAFTYDMDGQNVNVQWVQRYDYCNCGENEPQGMGIDQNENVYVGGYSAQGDNDSNWAVVKYSSAGSFLWEARYGGAAGGFDALYDMKVDYNTGDVFATARASKMALPIKFIQLSSTTEMACSNG